MIPGVVASARVPSGPPVPSSGFAGAVMARSPWGYWKLNDAIPFVSGSSVSALDASGNGRHGQYVTGTTGSGSASGLYGGTGSALQLTGNTYVALPNTSVPDGKLTVMVAFKASVSGIRHLLSADDTGSSRHWQFRLSGAGGIEVVSFSPSVAVLSAAGPYNDDSPHIATLVFDSSVAISAGQAKIYVDGLLVASSTVQMRVTSATTRPSIGSRGSIGNLEPFIGTVDDCAIFHSALTSAQVLEIYESRNTS